MISQNVIDKAAVSAKELFCYLHRHPELSWGEVETTDRLCAQMNALGIRILRRGVGKAGTGLIAQIDGERPGPVVALRADIDALPVRENSGVPYPSERDGVMHACGHDAHTSILTGAAAVLQSMRHDLTGSVRLIFQPAEESGYESGAVPMIQAGALDGVSAIFGLHVWALLPMGTIGWRSGAIMASADIWEVTVTGKGGHGSEPQTAIDPTVAAGAMIGALQSIVSREIDPREAAVVSIGRLNGGTAINIIPQDCFMAGNVRTTTRELREAMEEKFRRILNGLAEAYRCKVQLKWTPIYPVTVNDPDACRFFVSCLTDAGLGDRLSETPIILGSEDFSYYGQKIPANFCFLGMGTKHPHHSPEFRVDPEVIPLGIRVMAELGLGWGRKN